ncbi:MAG: hydroxymethylbilane synthase [Planctomycetota bacterium]
MKFRLATRSSPLALWQAEAAKRALGAAWSDAECEFVEVRSSGDTDLSSPLTRFGRIGIFTVEVDRVVIEGRADVAVHSCKDMTTELGTGTMLSAVLGRGPVEDALVAPPGTTLEGLPSGARVATSSARRRALLRSLRPDLEVVEIRGNVQTRLAKLAAGEADALLMARAGLERLGLGEHVSEVLDTERFPHAAGQGAVALVVKEGDWPVHERVQAVRDLETWDEVIAERAVLRELRGGCSAPIGVVARVVESTLALRARVLALDGSRSVEASLVGPRDAAESLGTTLGKELAARGARELMRT